MKGYPLGRIGDVVSDVHYGTSAKASDNGKYVYIRMNNITYEGALDLSDIKRIDVADSEIENYIVRYGDVLFNRTNSRDLVGKTCVFDRKNPMIIAGYIIRLRMNGLVLPEYLSLFMNTRYAKKLLFSMAKGAVGQANINAKELQDISIIIPPIDEQREFLTLVRQTDKSQFIERFGKPGTDPFGWGLTTLGECCELNPRKPKDMNTNIDYSFVAMPSVSEDGRIDSSIERPYSEVCKGFTYFGENDVLFAKITPCMENGKGGVAKKLKNGAGFGSTEFHVLRPIKGISDPYWIYILTMFPKFRSDAEKVMTGTGGQRRVPITYLNEYPIALPPIDLQEQFAAFVRQSDKSKLLISKLKELTFMGYRGHGKM